MKCSRMGWGEAVQARGKACGKNQTRESTVRERRSSSSSQNTQSECHRGREKKPEEHQEGRLVSPDKPH